VTTAGTSISAPRTGGEIRIGSLPLAAVPAEPDGTRAYPTAVDLDGEEAQRADDARAEGMEIGVRFEHRKLVCVAIGRGVGARQLTALYEPGPVDEAGVVRLRRTDLYRISASMADALSDPPPPPPATSYVPVVEGRRAPRASRRTRPSRRSSARAGSQGDEPPAAASVAVAGNHLPQQSTDDMSAAPAAEAGELHGSGVVCPADDGGRGAATGLDSPSPASAASGLAADDRKPLLDDVGNVVRIEGFGPGPVRGAALRRLGSILADLVMADLERNPPRR